MIKKWKQRWLFNSCVCKGQSIIIVVVIIITIIIIAHQKDFLNKKGNCIKPRLQEGQQIMYSFIVCGLVIVTSVCRVMNFFSKGK